VTPRTSRGFPAVAAVTSRRGDVMIMQAMGCRSIRRRRFAEDKHD
jgi:hypothetical protein